MKLDSNKLFYDYAYAGMSQPYSTELDMEVNGSRISGEIYAPGGYYEAPHPAVILCHGFPGTCNNDDLCQAWRRMGCVVIRLNHRGAWSSQGIYSFTNCIEDACAVAEYARGNHELQIDPERIFLVGHSMGGNTVLNATCRLPWLKGTIMLAPFDVSAVFRTHMEQSFKDMIHLESRVLHLNSEEELYQNAVDHQEEMSFCSHAEELKDRNLLLIGGSEDDIAPGSEMIDPLLNLLNPQLSNHIPVQGMYLPDSHPFDCCRMELARITGAWIEKQAK